MSMSDALRAVEALLLALSVHPVVSSVPALKVTTPDGVDDAIRAAQAVDGPALIWFETVEEQNVFPIMPAGKGLSDLIDSAGPEE